MPARLLVLVALSSVAFPLQAGEADFHGRWTITGSVTAPWVDPARAPVTDTAETYTGRIVEISPGRMSGPPLFDCGATGLTVEALPYAGLFEGGLAADPTDAAAPYDLARAKRLAEGLGFTGEPVETLSHGCSEVMLHRVSGTTLVFGLDNRIFTLARQ